MHDEHSRRREPSPAEQDARVERWVMTQVLAAHPTQLSILELARQLETENDVFARTDAVERAVRELTGVGLIQVVACRLIAPSRAALRFDELLGEVS
jgi:hypothetical protein